MAAGRATLQLVSQPGWYDDVEAQAQTLIAGMRERAAAHGVPFQAQCLGSMWGYFLRDEPVQDFAGAAAANMAQWQAFAGTMLMAGVNVAPSPFEAAFISSAHGTDEIAHTLAAADRAFAAAAAVVDG